MDDPVFVRKVLSEIESEMSKIVVGQKEIIKGIFRAILCDGHVLVEGVPGVAKTLIVRAMARILGCEMKRVQFYSLPEAQIDRFLFKLLISYPSQGDEVEILKKNTTIYDFEDYKIRSVLSPNKILDLQKMVKKVFASKAIEDYIVQIVSETRSKDFEFSKYISYGASPRASIALFIASKAEALLNGRDYVIPQDVKAVAYPVLRHRLILNYEAEADKILTDHVIKHILSKVHTP